MTGIDRTNAPEPKPGARPIAGERYYDPEFAAREWTHMWTHVWLIARRVDEFPKENRIRDFDETLDRHLDGP